jgi:hypothetical protein
MPPSPMESAEDFHLPSIHIIRKPADETGVRRLSAETLSNDEDNYFPKCAYQVPHKSACVYDRLVLIDARKPSESGTDGNEATAAI